MIREHAFNTAWWGKKVAIVSDRAFFDLPGAQRHASLAPYDWAEFKSPTRQAPPSAKLFHAGFFCIDVQIEFRIGLNQVVASSSLDSLQVEFADQSPFAVIAADLKPFENERYLALPGMSVARLSDRFAAWATRIIAAHPQRCLRLMNGGKTQGWFLSEPSQQGLHLTLAMLHRDADITGLHLYQKAMRCYAERGERIGWAGFSVRNSAVHNVYAKLGAHFTSTTGCWLWLSPALSSADPS
jgi:hypothetical protein